jgi:hypothetical protein
MIKSCSVSRKVITPLVAMGLLTGSLAAQAASVSYYLDQSNDMPDGTNYLQVTISDGASGNIDFSVQVLTPAFPSPGDNFGMQEFYFNYDNLLTVGTGNITGINPNSWEIKEDKNAGGGFGKFEFEAKGNGSSRTSLLTFSISGVAGDTIDSYAIAAGESGEFFAAHVGGFDAGNGVTSAKFAGSTVVPVPAAAWLFGSGLIGLISTGRRRR